MILNWDMLGRSLHKLYNASVRAYEALWKCRPSVSQCRSRGRQWDEIRCETLRWAKWNSAVKPTRLSSQNNSLALLGR